MNYNDFSAFVTNIVNDVVYISDIETYELYYLNKAGLNLIGNPQEEVWKNKKCFKILQGLDKPCSFCTNHLLKEGEFYVWEYYNPVFDNYFSLRDTLIDLDGVKARLEVATNVTQKALLEKDIKEKLEQEQVLNYAIETLHSNVPPDESIHKLLQIVATYHHAERGYIFSYDKEKSIIINTHEWCEVGIVPQIENLQAIDAANVATWFNKFEESGEFFIDSVTEELDPASEEYKVLNDQGISSLITAPLRDFDGNLTGFIGVDNPKKHIKKSSLIKAVTTFIADFFDKSDLIKKLHNLSYIDMLTGLKNRNSYRLLLEKLEKKLPDNFGIAYIDLMGLRTINDTKGHKFGDVLVLELSKFLVEIFEDNIYRIGGNEFIAFCENIEEDKFNNSISLLRKKVADNELLNLSIGYSWSKISDKHIVDKKKSSNVLSSDEVSSFTFRKILANNLESEIKQGRYTVYLQPQIDLQTKTISGAEALVRKFDQSGNLQFPDMFIPFYEKEDIISLIDFFVFEKVNQLISNWQKQGYNDKIKFSVNFSRLSLSKIGLEKDLAQICRQYEVDPSRIIIEITETMNSISDELLTTIIQNFTNEGFSVSLDDFGSGYSNLSIIVSADFSEIKLDKSLIDKLGKNEKSQIITQMAIDICNSLNHLESVAEGIETKEQCELLTQMKCQKGQGYYFDRPMKISDFENKYIKKQ